MCAPHYPKFVLIALLVVAVHVGGTGTPASAQGVPERAKAILDRVGVTRGLCVVLGDTDGGRSLELARASELTIYVQSESADAVAAARRAAEAAGLLGSRIYVEQGKGARVHLADDLADAVVVLGPAPRDIPKAELLRVVRPGGKVLLGEMQLAKPIPKGTDEWSHPYHGADNNPQSKDQLARGPFLTHFMAEPWYASMPQMTVISGGRIFKAFGNRTSARPQWPVINTLLAMSAFNGTVLWKRELADEFMLHRNTLIATTETVYLADDKSCKLIDAATGKLMGEIAAPAELSDGPIWKWMALEGGVLYALVGETEPKVPGVRGNQFRGAGWPWWEIRDYRFGFGRTLLAIDPATKKVLWHHRETEPLDSRAVCMAAGRIFLYSHGKHLGAIDAKTGKPLWKTSDEKLLAAIGAHDPAQHWMKGFASTAYVKCSDKALYFAGPQRKNIVAVSAQDGKLLWQRAGGNSQLVLRDDGLYALGEGSVNSAKSSFKLEPLSGEVVATFPSRDRCTRATGCVDAIFTRGGRGGSTAVFDVTSNEPKMSVISPMRPACQDGVVVAHGNFYWGPWMCRCDHTQVGVISLTSGGDLDYAARATDAERLEVSSTGPSDVKPLPVTRDDWPAYRKASACSANSSREVPAKVALRWTSAPSGQNVPTAPVAAGDLAFHSGTDGIVRALDPATGKPRWTAYTGGAVRYPPAIAGGRVYVGSGDGWVYCLEAASGRLLWRFRAAPVERKIPVFGSLLSTWPVGSGVLVHDGVVCAAAGIANHDGTHVYALDAATGKIRWQNNTSGHLYDQEKDTGMGVQSHLLLHDGAIYMAGGSLAPVGSYDIKDGTFRRRGSGHGKDLFVHLGQVQASGYLLYARPEDLHYVEAVGLPVGAVGATGSASAAKRHVGLAKGKIALAEQSTDPKGKAKSLWIAEPLQEVAALAVTPNAVLVTGVDRRETKGQIETSAALVALGMGDGKVMWKHPLPAAPVSWGLAVDRRGQVLVALQDGRLLCFGGER